MESTAFNHAAWNPVHSITLHGIHCIQSGCILISCMESIQSSRCMDSAAYSRDPLCHNAWNPLHSIGMHFTRLHGIHCTQSRCMESTAFNQEAFYQAAWNQLHLITLHGIHCIQSGCIFPGCMESTAFNNAAGNHCILSCCMESTALNRVPFLHPAWNPLHSITLHVNHRIQSICI